MVELTIAHVTAANRSRCERWHPGFPDDEQWTLSDWSNAMVGEVGETAEALEDWFTLRIMNRLTARAGAVANTVKKVRRAEGGHRGVLDPPEDELRRRLAAEIADVYLYLDLLATRAGVDLPTALALKFNEVSEKQGFPERLEVTDARA